MSQKLNTSLIGSLIGLVMAAVFWADRGKWTWLSAVFPDFVLIALAALSAVLLLTSLVRPSLERVFEGQNLARASVTAALILAWVWAIDVIGFVVASFVCMLAMLVYLTRGTGPRGLRRYAYWTFVTAALIGFFYVVFTRVLYVPLPTGLLF